MIESYPVHDCSEQFLLSVVRTTISTEHKKGFWPLWVTLFRV